MNRTLPVGALLIATLSLSARGAELGMTAPSLKISQWIKGDPVDVTSADGKKIYVVEFWATWCPPCRTSVPHLTKLQERFKKDGVVIIGISNEKAGTVQAYVKKMKKQMDYVVAIDQGNASSTRYMKAFAQRGIPHAFVVNRDGKISWHGHPMAGLDRVLEQMVAGTYDIQKARTALRGQALLTEYFALATRGGRKKPARQLGREILQRAKESPNVLNELAWGILTRRGLADRDYDLALSAAEVAYAQSKGKDAAIIDMYARALFDKGEKEKAIVHQKEAVAKASDPGMKSQLQNTLRRYQAARGR